ncbi:MAG TPA: zf-HC2 domain-containing protein [Myxococcaceae bacterium]|jgi:predicted anti-sigma-YlaC factor YlaD|nr:zf-HC2 domain-containing protein [Myxococcaceae bacterium]
MLSCQQITDLVTDFLEGRLGLADRARVVMHLGMCRHCWRYVRQMKVAIATLGCIPAEAPPPEVADELQARFRNWKLKAGRAT